MGRTLPTATQLLALEKEGWSGFRRALRKEDQAAFDALWRWARRHTAPLSMAGRAVPFEGVVMAMLLEIARRLPPEVLNREPFHEETLPGMDL